jgi:DNA (cytosine-5)-methyltransferase 1
MNTMIYGSVCSGIEAATVAWHPLGWSPAFFSEIEKFPRAVLEHHYPGVPLHGDFTTIGEDDYGAIDLLVGGTPCQSFSIAGLRGGLDDDRGNLALEFLLLAQRKRPEWLLWENVPGVLSSDGGRDFGSILGGMGELGYRWAYRVLDAQYFGVAQRRRRVFVVGHIGDWRRAAAVLSEREGLQRDNPPSREAWEAVAGTIDAGSGRRRGAGTSPEMLVPHRYSIGVDEECNASVEQFGPLLRGGQGGTRQSVAVFGGGDCSGSRDVAATLAATLAAHGTRQDFDVENFVVHGTQDPNVLTDQAHALGRNSGQENVVTTLAIRGRGDSHQLEYRTDGTANAILTPNGGRAGIGVGAVHYDMTVRRLTPRECERLQGFPDDYTQIQWRGKPAEECPDGPRYKALGNSMAVPVMRWIGERINQVNALERVA